MNLLSWTPPDTFMELLHVEAASEITRLIVESTRSSSCCPTCSRSSNRSHSRYTRKVQDEPYNGRPVELLILSRKWFCEYEDCPVKIFTERFDGLSPNRRRTQRAEYILRKIAFSTSCLTAEKIAHAIHMPISHDALLALIYRTDIISEVSPFPGN